MNLQSKGDDDFFGDQSDDEDDLNHSDKACAITSTGGGLTAHEARAAEDNFRKIGFLEAFEESKESRLQDGFESGYREVIDSASNLGRILGKIAMRSQLSSDCDDSASHNAARKVKQLLLKYDSEMKDADTGTKGDAFVKEVEDYLKDISSNED